VWPAATEHFSESVVVRKFNVTPQIYSVIGAKTTKQANLYIPPTELESIVVTPDSHTEQWHVSSLHHQEISPVSHTTNLISMIVSKIMFSPCSQQCLTLCRVTLVMCWPHKCVCSYACGFISKVKL